MQPQRQRWVATVPPGAARRPRARRRLPYLGPPNYSAPPRWGFPALAWRWPTAVPGTTTDEPITVDRVRTVGGHAAAMMWALAGLAVLAAGGEIWRYVLLLKSRTGALTSRVVSTSDAVVTIAAVLTLAFSVVAVVVTLYWLRLARHAAARVADQKPARKDGQVLAYLLIPGLNLAMAGVLLAELEHQVLHRSPTSRVRPSGSVIVWWIVWAVAGILFATTVITRFRTSVQAEADGVIQSALTDLAAAAVAVLTALMIRRLSTLLAPIDGTNVRFMRVVRVEGAPEPPLRETRVLPSRR